MKRILSLMLLVIFILGCVMAYSTPSVKDAFGAAHPTVLLTTDSGLNLTTQHIGWVVVFVSAWIFLVGVGFSISDDLGFFFLRIGLDIAWIILNIAFGGSSSNSSNKTTRSGSGSSKSNRGN